MNFHVPAMVMIIPTMGVALLICWQTRYLLSEFLHNVAVILWITANTTWMIGEFYGWDENLYHGYGLRQFALIPFVLGLGVLLYYYIFLARKKSFREKMVKRTEELIKSEMITNDQ